MGIIANLAAAKYYNSCLFRALDQNIEKAFPVSGFSSVRNSQFKISTMLLLTSK